MSSPKKPNPKKPPARAAKDPKAVYNVVDAAIFAATWNSSQTLSEVADRLGVPASTCRLYAARLREAGKDLKTFPRGRPRLLKM